MHPQKWKSDICNLKYCEKTTENDLQQLVESTKFGTELGMNQKSEISIEIRFVKFNFITATKEFRVIFKPVFFIIFSQFMQ